jgi:LPXTG-motif cell wall-anchored protein
VYVVLYLNDAPVLNKNGNAKILRLDAASDWKGFFTVALADEDDSLSNYNYSIREVSQIRTDNLLGWNPAILENDGKTLLYYEEALETGRLFTVNGKSYIVEYGTGESGQLTVTNYWGTILPETGGMGTHMYTISGLLLILAAALIFGYSQRRKTERGASR